MPVGRPLAGDTVVLDLDREIETTRAAHAPSAGAARAARTLIKDGPLRVTLIVLEAGGEIAEHSADGPVTIHPLDGMLRVQIGQQQHELAPGQLLAIGGGVRHSVASPQGASFLLTLALR